MPLNAKQRQIIEGWMRSKDIVHCAACGAARWRFSEAAYVRGLLEYGEPDLVEDQGVVRITCDNCGYMMLFDAETIGIRAMWDKNRGV
jgi:predicted nucleic-acid-binding Zn-ribbon protein